MKNKRILTILLSVFLIGVTACNGSSVSTDQPAAVMALINNEPVTKVYLETAETMQLTAIVSPASSVQTVEWSTSDELIATISATGLIEGISKGIAVITVSSTELTYVNQQLFVEVKNKLGQTGIGSGTSAFDPIFLGNEGEDEPLEVYFLETYDTYGDSIYLKKGNVDVIVDAGNVLDGELNNDFIKDKVSDGRIDLLVATHSHGDHYGGIRNIIKGIEDVSTIIDYGITAAKPDYKQLVDELTANGKAYYPAIDCVKEENGAVGKFYLTNEFYVQVLNTGNYISDNTKGAENGQSLALMFFYRDFKFFTAGDLTTSSELDLLKNENMPRVTLYKASHHGSKSSNSQQLLNVLDPKAVAISVTRSGRFNITEPELNENNTSNLNGTSGHPYAEPVERMYSTPRIKQNLNMYWNAVNGTMRFTTYGEDDVTFQGSPTRKGYYDLTLTNGTPSWNPVLNDFDNKVTGEDNKKLHETKMFEFRGYQSFVTL